MRREGRRSGAWCETPLTLPSPQGRGRGIQNTTFNQPPAILESSSAGDAGGVAQEVEEHVLVSTGTDIARASAICEYLVHSLSAAALPRRLAGGLRGAAGHRGRRSRSAG